MGRNAFRFKRTSLQQILRLILVLAIGGQLVVPADLSAAPSLPASLSSPFLRSLILETRAGARFLGALEREANLGSSLSAADGLALARWERFSRILRQARFQPLSRGLERQLEEAEAAADRAAVEAIDAARLTPGEREALELVAQRLLTLRPDWSRNLAPATGLEPEAFFVTVSSPGEALAEQVLSAETGVAAVDPAYEAGTLPLSTAEAEPLLDRWRLLFSDMNRCIDGMSSTDRKAAERRWALQGFIQSQLFTIGGNLLGSKTIDWKSLPTDMLVSALWSGVNARALFSTTRVTVQWLRLEAMSQARSGLDAAIYFVNPYKDTHGKSNWESTLERERFNATYNLFSPFVTIGTQRLLMGLECLFPGGRTRALTSGLRFASQIGTTFVYYRLRSEALDGG